MDLNLIQKEEMEKKMKKEKRKVPECNVGDVVKVATKIEEGGKQRLQVFQGTVIAQKGAGINRSIWVRKVTQGVGVEKKFMLYSPALQDLKVIRKGKVRRAKLYYLRERVGRKAKVKAAE